LARRDIHAPDIGALVSTEDVHRLEPAAGVAAAGENERPPIRRPVGLDVVGFPARQNRFPAGIQFLDHDLSHLACLPAESEPLAIWRPGRELLDRLRTG